MKVLLRKLPNGRRALFLVTKQNRKHIKVMFTDYIGFDYYKGHKCRWLDLGFLTIKTKGL